MNYRTIVKLDVAGLCSISELLFQSSIKGAFFRTELLIVYHYSNRLNTCNTCYSDMDAGPTKAWMIHHRSEEQVRKLFQMGFGKFPAEELYDLRIDPYYINNVVEDQAYSGVRRQLADQLMAVLKEQEDPRVVEPDCRFERSPFADG